MRKYICICLLLIVSSVRSQWTPEMDSLAKVTEENFCLPSGICRAFALQESNYNPNAERVEGNYVTSGGTYAKNIRRSAYAFSINHGWQPSVLTEIYQRGKSVTMFQVMGQNIRDLGYNEPYLNHISLPEQFVFFGTFVSKLYKKHKGNMASVASEYNGGYGAVAYKLRNGVYRNQSYVNSILKYIKRFENHN